MNQTTHCANCGGDVAADEPHRVGQCNPPPTLTLTEFLLARLDEDQYEAEHPDEEIPSKMLVGGRVVDRDRRALAIVAAHRAVVVEHEPDGSICARCAEPGEWGYASQEIEWPCPTIRAIASIWADYEGYRAEWSA